MRKTNTVHNAGNLSIACVGIFCNNERIAICKRCSRCIRHLDYIYGSESLKNKPVYVKPSECTKAERYRELRNRTRKQ